MKTEVKQFRVFVSLQANCDKQNLRFTPLRIKSTTTTRVCVKQQKFQRNINDGGKKPANNLHWWEEKCDILRHASGECL